MMDRLAPVAADMADHPLVGLTLTLLAWQAAQWLFEKSGRRPVANPVLVAILLLMGVLWITGIPYDAYFEGARFIHFLLGPATVALAVPIYRQLQRVRGSAGALAAGILAGGTTAAVTAMGLAWALGATRGMILSLAPKSATTPIAMGVTESLGGLPSLTAVLVILTGILGAVLGPTVLRLVRVRGQRAQGVALGTASHGIGTARAFGLGEVAGAFSGLAMGLNGVATAVLVPLLWWLVAG